MRRGTGDNFVWEVEMAPSVQQEEVLFERTEAAHSVYNACLAEAERRLDLCQAEPEWDIAKRLRDEANRQRQRKAAAAGVKLRDYKNDADDLAKIKAYNALYTAVKRRHGFHEFSLISWVIQVRHAHG